MHQRSWLRCPSIPVVTIGTCVASAIFSCSSGAHDLLSDAGDQDATTTVSDDGGGGGVFERSDSGSGSGDRGCASANVELTRASPNVWLIVNGGGDSQVLSGNAQGTLSVWDSARAALFGPGGLVPTLQQQVAFGFILDGSDYEATPCPTFVPIAPALNADRVLRAAYPVVYPDAGGNYQEMQPYALSYVLSHLPTAQQKATNPTLGQQAVIVDINDPDLCFADFSSGRFADGGPPAENLNAQAERLTIAAIQSLTNAGVKVYLFAPNYAVGGGNAAYFTAAVAATNTGHGVFTPGTTADLVAAMTMVTEELLSCDVTLNGTVGKGLECSGSVAVDGAPVPCDTPDGWHLKDPSTIELVGAACTGLRSKPMAKITAAFPCAALVPR